LIQVGREEETVGHQVPVDLDQHAPPWIDQFQMMDGLGAQLLSVTVSSPVDAMLSGEVRRLVAVPAALGVNRP
jgi:hypothetical protein